MIFYSQAFTDSFIWLCYIILQPDVCTLIGCVDNVTASCQTVLSIQPNGPGCPPRCRLCADDIINPPVSVNSLSTSQTNCLFPCKFCEGDILIKQSAPPVSYTNVSFLISVYGNTWSCFTIQIVINSKFRSKTQIHVYLCVCRIHVSVLKWKMKQLQRLYSIQIWAPFVLWYSLRCQYDHKVTTNQDFEVEFENILMHS